MTPCRRVAATASLIGAVCGCGASTEPNTQVTAMVPSAAFNDAAFSALIAGDSFRPAYRFDTMAAASQTDVGAFSVVLASADGATTIPLEGVSWQSPKALAATAPAGIPAGSYDVVITDPRASQFRLTDGFRSLGADDMPPAVTIESPLNDTLVGEGATVTVILSADDGQGSLQALDATVMPDAIRAPVSCAIPTDARTTRCSFEFVAPAPTDDMPSVRITASATDSVRNEATSPPTTLRLAPRPTLVSASRDSGPASGGTAIVAEGTGFIEDATQMLIGGAPVPTLWLSSTMLQGTTLRHEPGDTAVTIATAGAESAAALRFTFIGTPVIRQVCPLRSPVAGGISVTILGNNFRPQTSIYFGGVAIKYPTIHPNRIDGFIPPSPMGTTGQVSIYATDPVSSFFAYSEPLVYFDPGSADDAPDAGTGSAMCDGVQ